MSITDELREWAKTLTHWWYDPVKDEYTYTTGTMPPSIDAIRLDSNIIAIIDRIDAEHESACAEAYGNGVQSVALPDMTAYVKLPVDADGEYIRIGDVMENIVCPSVHREVTGVGVECFYGWDDGNGRYSQFDANCYRHHHAPTVEDVLREFSCVLMGKREFDGDVAEAISEYAKRLTLAGDGE